MSVLLAVRAQARGHVLFRHKTRIESQIRLSLPWKNTSNRAYTRRPSGRTESESQITSRTLQDAPGSVISTLDPDKITSKDYLDFSQDTSEFFRTSVDAVIKRGNGRLERSSISNKVLLKSSSLKAYLLGQTGFLYYHQEIDQIPLSGGLRFRLAAKPSVTAFRKGKDLDCPRLGSPWRLPLFQIVKSRPMAPLLAQLVHDGLVTDETVNECRQLIKSNRHLPSSAGWKTQIIYSFDEPFILNFHAESHTVHILDIERCRIWYMHFQSNRYPYVGKCTVRLEEIASESSSSDASKSPFKTATLRVVRIVERFRWQESVVPQSRWKLPRKGSSIAQGVRIFDQRWNTGKEVVPGGKDPM